MTPVATAGHGPGRSAGAHAPDRTSRNLLLLGAAVLLFSFGIALLAPAANDDPTPSTWNTDRSGAKAALLVLEGLGYQARAFALPLNRLPLAEAAHTTLVLAEPTVPYAHLPEEQSALDAFLRSGGSVLATGLSGALLLRQTEVRYSTHPGQALCLTQPEGFSPLARAGSLRMPATLNWGAPPATEVEVAQRCGTEPVVVRWRPQGGLATWWASPEPLSNAGLRQAASLRLLLASVAPSGRQLERQVILFDEYCHGAAAEEPNPLAGLPLPLLLAQAALVLMLLVFSFSRRHGPIRSERTGARSSPAEFAVSMGALYGRAGAASAAVEAAHRRLLRTLQRRAALPAATLQAGPPAIAEALRARYGAAETWDALAAALEQATAFAQAAAAGSQPRKAVRDAAALVRGLDAYAEQLAVTRGAIGETRTPKWTTR